MVKALHLLSIALFQLLLNISVINVSAAPFHDLFFNSSSSLRLMRRAPSSNVDEIFNRLDGLRKDNGKQFFLKFNDFKQTDESILPPETAFAKDFGVDDSVCKKSPPSSDPNKNIGVTFFCVNFLQFERCEGGKIIKNIFRPSKDNNFNKGCVGGGFCLGKPGQNPCIDLSKENIANALKGGVYFKSADRDGKGKDIKGGSSLKGGGEGGKGGGAEGGDGGGGAPSGAKVCLSAGCKSTTGVDGCSPSSGTQFVTGKCSTSTDCASGCCVGDLGVCRNVLALNQGVGGLARCTGNTDGKICTK